VSIIFSQCGIQARTIDYRLKGCMNKQNQKNNPTKCPDARWTNHTNQFDWKMPPSKSSLPDKQKTVLIVRHFGAPPVIRLP